MSYYEIIGVEEDADFDEIKSRYRKLAMKYHPDRNQGNKEAEEIFKKVNEAYETIGNREKRTEYDKRKMKKSGRGFEEKEKWRKNRGKGKEEGYSENFSFNPEDIKNMFGKMFDTSDMRKDSTEEMKSYKKNMQNSFESFFNMKKNR